MKKKKYKHKIEKKKKKLGWDTTSDWLNHMV